MPIYEYKCDKCQEVTEEAQKFTDKPLTTCECGGRLTKLISRSSFKLKGSGWYETDFKHKGKKPKDKPKDDKAKDAKESKDSKELKDSKETKTADSKDSKPAKSEKKPEKK